MSKTTEIIQQLTSMLFATRAGDRVCQAGAKLWDAEGKVYLISWRAFVLNVGHSHPVVVDAIRQAGQKMHVSNLYYTENQTLAQALAGLALGGKCFCIPAPKPTRR